jgi:hypothetical protein
VERFQSDLLGDSTVIASSLTEKMERNSSSVMRREAPSCSVSAVLRRVGVLVSDGASEIREAKLQRQLLARSCKHQVAARGAHHENGPAERAVQEIDAMIRASIVLSGIPMKEWCFVAEHILTKILVGLSWRYPRRRFYSNK